MIDYEETLSNIITAALEGNSADELQNYLQRGRRFKALSDDKLLARFTSNLKTRHSQLDFIDLRAEIELRNIKLPADIVSEMKQAVSGMEDPQKFEQFVGQVMKVVKTQFERKRH
jgi:hypothetical protein